MLEREGRIVCFGIWIVSVRVVGVGGMLKVCKMGLRVRNCAVRQVGAAGPGDRLHVNATIRQVAA